MNKRLQLLCGAATAILMAMPAQAGPIVRFDTGPAGQGGWFSVDGSSYIGSNIPVGILGVGDTAPWYHIDATFPVTGPAPGSGGGFYGRLDFEFSPTNNFITILGCVPGLNIGAITASGMCTQPATLVSGSFFFWEDNGFGFPYGIGTDVKNRALLDAFDLAGMDPLLLALVGPVGWTLPRDGTPVTVGSTAIINEGFPHVFVPEPATMVLFGTGLLAVLGVRRRRGAHIPKIGGLAASGRPLESGDDAPTGT